MYGNQYYQIKIGFLNYRKALSVLVATTTILTFFFFFNLKEKHPHERTPPFKGLPGACFSNCSKCGYTLLYPGGYGAKFHDMIFAWSWSLQNNVTYKGVVGSYENNKTLFKFFQLLNLPFNLQLRPFENCSLLSNYKANHLIQDNPFFNRVSKKVGTKRKVVVHVRRGDVVNAYRQTGDYFRYIPNKYFLNLIETIARQNDHVIILSQKSESFQEFIQAGYDVRLDSSELETWMTIINADVFIMSRSSFSYVPALFCSGTVYYDEFWAKPLKHWKGTFITENVTISRLTKTLMNETTHPCSGGDFGATTIQTYVCVISKANVLFSHMPHWAQVVYPCWSWFSEKRAKNCAFLVKDNLSNRWFDFISVNMGCQTLRTEPAQCAVLGMLHKSTAVGLGDSYSWLTSPFDASKLQHNIFRRKFERKTIGLLERKMNRRLNVDKYILSDLVYFENLSYYNQCKWMHEHKIIIGAHGAAMTQAICIQKCTVVIQLYPDHYYPNKFYEALIRESGGIPISWIKGKYLGSNETLAMNNEAMLQHDFEQEIENRSHWKTRDISINETILSILLQMAKTQQEKCENKSPAW